MGRSGRVNLSTCACQTTNTHTVHSNLARVHPPRVAVAVAVAVLVAHRVVAASVDLVEALAAVEVVLGAEAPCPRRVPNVYRFHSAFDPLSSSSMPSSKVVSSSASMQVCTHV